MANFKKLVRDKIPELIIENGEVPVTRPLSDEEYQEELKRKLMEEVVEYIDDVTTDELADILEVVYALGALHGATAADLERQRKKKATDRGAFANRVFLVSVEEQPE
jgi:predicted house-cleaning noncanonical NTP pyrophosphatase (MazG superfamily)